MNAPIFNKYYATEEDMDGNQRRFYNYWKSKWERGEKIFINGQISYIFCFIYNLLALPFELDAPKDKSMGIQIIFTFNGHRTSKILRKDYISQTKKIIESLNRIILKYKEEEKLIWYCKFWLSDCYVLLKNFKNALMSYPRLYPDEKSERSTTALLNLKLLNGISISGYDILTLNGAKVTDFGKKNLEKVSQYLEILIKEKETKEGINILERWKETKSNYNIFTGSFNSYAMPDVPYYNFGYYPEVRIEIQQLTRDAENTVRDEMGIPHIGEGWVSETELYYKIKQAFPNIEIVHHASPNWLGAQHIDIFIPSKMVGIEYQGIQHFKPVDYFGGEESFKANQKRDRIKRRKCTKNGVQLLEVNENYKIEDLIKQISEITKNKELK